MTGSVCTLGEWQLGPGLSIDLVSYPGGHTYPRHAHETLDLSLVLAGSVRERIGGDLLEVEPMDVIVKPPGVEHSNHFGEAGVEILRLRVDPGLAEARELMASGSPPSQHRGGHLAKRLTSLAMAAHLSVSAKDVTDQVVEMVAACGENRPTIRRGPVWLDRVEAAISDRLGEPLRVRELAAEAGRHPVHLARVFRRVHGVSVTAFIRRRRVQAALAAIRSSDLSLSWIAAECGFADQAHMSRSVRRELGLPPSGLRAIGRKD